MFSASTTPGQRVQLRRMLATALAEDPGQRYQTGDAFAAAAMAIANGESGVLAAIPVARAEQSIEIARTPAADVARPGIEAPAVTISPASSTADEHDVMRPFGHVSPMAVAVGAEHRSRSSTSCAVLAGVAIVTFVLGSSLAYLALRARSGVAQSPASGSVAHDAARPSTDVFLEPERAAPVAAPPAEPLPVQPDAQVDVARTNRLDIRSEPSGALVTIDGRISGATPTTVRSLSPGTYVVRVARPGHVPREARVTLASASVRTLMFEHEPGLDASMPSVGAVDVDSRPRGAEVVIDGRVFGRTPFRAPALRPGVHDVVLKLGGYSPAAQRVNVAAGHRSIVNVTLQALVP